MLDALARQATADGSNTLADAVSAEVGQMRRQVDRVLARARAGITAAIGNKSVEVAPVAEKIVRVFRQLPDTRPLQWTTEIAPAARFPGEDGDLTEILGNLIDNARKWARSQIRLTVRADRGVLTMCVEDDGPGLSLEQVEQVGRGQRWDDTQPGTGFGVAITRDLAEGYRGTLDLGRSDLGGLRATVTVPLPPHGPIAAA